MQQIHKSSLDCFHNLEKNYDRFLDLHSPKEADRILRFTLSFFNAKGFMYYKNWLDSWGGLASLVTRYPLLNCDEEFKFIFVPSLKIFAHYKWLARHSKTFYYNYQRFDDFQATFELCRFVQLYIMEYDTKESPLLSSAEINAFTSDFASVSQLEDEFCKIIEKFPYVHEAGLVNIKKYQFSSNADLHFWFNEAFAFRFYEDTHNFKFSTEFKANQSIPKKYYIDLILSFEMLAFLFFEGCQIFGNRQDFIFVVNYYLLSLFNPVLAALQIRYSYYYFVEKNRETIFKDLYIYWFGKPLKKNKKYGHIFYLVRHKEKQFLYYIALTINFTDKNFSDENIALDYKDPVIQNELEDRLILQHYTLNVDTTHFDNNIAFPQFADLRLTLNFTSSKLSNMIFENLFNFKFLSENKRLTQMSSQYLEDDYDYVLIYYYNNSHKFVPLSVPNKFEDNNSDYIETDYKPTYDDVVRLPEKYTKRDHFEK
jgi:hypothetical protein